MSVHTCMCLCMNVFVLIRVCVCVRMPMYACLCVGACMCVHICVLMCICVYVCVHTHMRARVHVFTYWEELLQTVGSSSLGPILCHMRTVLPYSLHHQEPFRSCPLSWGLCFPNHITTHSVA